MIGELFVYTLVKAVAKGINNLFLNKMYNFKLNKTQLPTDNKSKDNSLKYKNKIKRNKWKSKKENKRNKRKKWRNSNKMIKNRNLIRNKVHLLKKSKEKEIGIDRLYSYLIFTKYN